MIGVNGAWVRPREVLVDVRFERQIADRLRQLGGRPYVPSNDEDDWRQRPFVPDYGDVNAQLDEAELGFHLWVGFSTRRAVKLARDGELPGVHFNVVYRGEEDSGVQDYYQGGPLGHAINAATAPTFLSYAGDGIVDLAVLDTGLPQNWENDYSALTKSVKDEGPGFDRVGDPLTNVVDTQGCHGLFICGLIARHKPEVDIGSHQVLTSTGETDDTKVCPTITKSKGAVVNLSLGGFSPTGTVSPVMDNAVKAAVKADRILVAAAGNDGGIYPSSSAYNRPFWPAAHPDVIAVGAFDSNSTTTPPQLWVSTNQADVYAPGVGLLSLHAKAPWMQPPTGPVYQGSARWSGTSFATPVVAAELASKVVNKTSGRRTEADLWLGSLSSPPGWSGKPLQPGPGKQMDPAPVLTS